MTSENISQILKEIWEERKIWSLTADQLKQNIDRWRIRILFLTILGAVLETLAAQLHSSQADLSKYIGLLGALCLVLIPILRNYHLKANHIQEWVKSRSVSEGLKTEVYLYATDTEPYNDPIQKDTKLATQRDEMVASAGKSLLRHKNEAKDKLDKNGLMYPRPMNIDEYIANRVNHQIEKYYEPKASELFRKANKLRMAELGSSIVAATLGVITAFFGNNDQFSIWVAVVTTIGIAITAHLAASRFDYLVDSYLATADRLKSLCNQWRISQQSGTPQNSNDFVRQCEDAISVENQGWMAKFLQTDK